MPDVAFAGPGQAVLVYSSLTEMPSYALLYSASQTLPGLWSAPAQISPSFQSAQEISVSGNGNGTAVATWHDITTIRAAVYEAGAWSPSGAALATISSSLGDIGRAAIATDGTATAVWLRYDGASWRVETASRPASGSWQLPATALSVNPSGDVPPTVAANGAGDLVAAWGQSDGANIRIAASIRPAGGGWQPSDALVSSAGASVDSAAVAIDSTGVAVVAWTDGWGGALEAAFSEAQAPADSDSDGIADSVDLSPFSFSDAFSDVPLGGTTFGSILDRNGCYVSVVDAPNPLDGVRFGNSCPGGGPATISISCPGGLGTLTIPDGGLIVGTCGSFYYGTIVGPTSFTSQSFYNGVLRETVLHEDSGETSVVADNGDGSYSVINTSLNGGPITVTYGPYTMTMPPDTACIVNVLPSGALQVTDATAQNSTAPPITVNGQPAPRTDPDQTVTLPPPAVGGISETPDVSTLPSVASAPGGRNTLWVVSAALGLAGLAMVAGWKLRRRLSAS